MADRLAEGADVDAMLGNWDVIGMAADNILVDKDGKPWRIDNGGSLSFRAQGGKKKGWAEGWPDELFTLATNDNNKAYIGDTPALRLVRQAAKRDWDAILERLPEGDRAPMRKRVAEMRQLAERADDFGRGGYTDDFTGQILTHSYALSKEGFREEVPKTIKDGDYGFCRTQKSAPGSIKEKKEENYGTLALDALKTVGTHAKDGKYNQDTLNAFYAKEQELKEILKASPNNKGAKHYLDIMAQVKHAVETQSTLPMLDVSVKVRQPETKAELSTKYTSLTDHIAKYMKRNKIDYGNTVKQWFYGQGKDSWDLAACYTKIAELDSRGENWAPPPPAQGVWYGSGGNDGPMRERNYRTIVARLKNGKKGKKEFDDNNKAFAMYKAATQLVLENASFTGNDRTNRLVTVFRTEASNVVGKHKKGERFMMDCGPSESTSIFKTVKVHGGVGTIAKVPYSRINATYFLEGTPGGNDALFMGDSENEFNVNLTGIERTYVGAVKEGWDVTQFYKLM